VVVGLGDPSQLFLLRYGDPDFWTRHLCGNGSRGNQPRDPRIVVVMARNNSTSNAQRERRRRECALTSAQFIQFAPYLAR
jgi:hypothetical protein